MKEKYSCMNRADTYSLMLLAGGKSSRMGQNKAELLYKGKTFTDYSIEKAEKLGINQIYLSGNQKVTEAVQIIQDIYQEKGPLGGIHACMKAMKTPYCLILPVDVPQIPVEALESMLNYHERYCLNVEGKQLPLLLKHESFMEPLIGIYPVTMADFVEKRIMEERLSVFRMIEAWGCESFEAEIQNWQAANINTRDEYEKLLKRV